MTLDAETAAWSGVQGDGWYRSWTRSTTGRTFSATNLLVQLRNTATGALVASSEASEQTGGVVAIDVSDTDFSTPSAYVFAFEITDTADIPVGTDYQIEAQCDVDGRLTTFFSHSWECRKQWADPA